MRSNSCYHGAKGGRHAKAFLCYGDLYPGKELYDSKAFETRAKVWTKTGVLEAVKWLLKEPNTLFDDMTKKLLDYLGLKEMIRSKGGLGWRCKIKM